MVRSVRAEHPGTRASATAGAVPLDDYVLGTRSALAPFGFRPANTLAIVAACRDELAGALSDAVRNRWGAPFQLAGLAGMVTLGRTGLAAAYAHAPMSDGRRRYVVYAMPHLGVDEQGTPGFHRRPGQTTSSPTCGALMALRDEPTAGRSRVGLDQDDLEQSLLRQRLAPRLPVGPAPAIADLTRIALDVILDDLRRAFARDPEWAAADVAIFGGIHVHAPGADLVLAGPSVLRRPGDRRSGHIVELDLTGKA